MLSYTLINSHSQVSDPGPKGPLFIIGTYPEFRQKQNRLVDQGSE